MFADARRALGPAPRRPGRPPALHGSTSRSDRPAHRHSGPASGPAPPDQGGTGRSRRTDAQDRSHPWNAPAGPGSRTATGPGRTWDGPGSAAHAYDATMSAPGPHPSPGPGGAKTARRPADPAVAGLFGRALGRWVRLALSWGGGASCIDRCPARAGRRWPGATLVAAGWLAARHLPPRRCCGSPRSAVRCCSVWAPAPGACSWTRLRLDRRAGLDARGLPRRPVRGGPAGYRDGRTSSPHTELRVLIPGRPAQPRAPRTGNWSPAVTAGRTGGSTPSSSTSGWSGSRWPTGRGHRRLRPTPTRPRQPAGSPAPGPRLIRRRPVAVAR